MKWKNIETRIDSGARNLVFVTKSIGSTFKTFKVYNYSGDSRINSMLCLLEVPGKIASCSFNYKNKIWVAGYELPTEIYDFFKTSAMHLAFDRLGITLFFEEELEESKYKN